MKKKTPKQIAALVCAILLVSMYIFTFIAACLDTPGSGRLFAACLTATIVLPVLLWIFLWFFGLLKERQSEALDSLPDGKVLSDTKHSERTKHSDNSNMS